MRGLLPVEPRPGGDVGLYANDRLDFGAAGPRIELDSTEHVAVVGHCHRIHIQLFAPGKELVERDGAV